MKSDRNAHSGVSTVVSINGCLAFSYAPKIGSPLCSRQPCVSSGPWCREAGWGDTFPCSPKAVAAPSALGVPWAQDCLPPLPCPHPLLYLSVRLCSDSSPTPAPPPAGGIICFIQSGRYLKPPVPLKVPSDGITPTWVF